MRLFPTILRQIFSAYLGFCTQVYGRASRQLHPWELDSSSLDVEAASTCSNPPLDWNTTVQQIPLSPITPTSDSSTTTPPTSSSALFFPPSSLESNRKTADDGASFRKAPSIFGPETLVMEPRVKELQAKMVRDILVVGVLWAVMGATVVLGTRGVKG